MNTIAIGISMNIEDEEYKISETVALITLFPFIVSNLFISSTVLQKQNATIQIGYILFLLFVFCKFNIKNTKVLKTMSTEIIFEVSAFCLIMKRP